MLKYLTNRGYCVVVSVFYYYVKRSWFFVDFVYSKLYNKVKLTYSKNTGKEYRL